MALSQSAFHIIRSQKTATTSLCKIFLSRLLSLRGTQAAYQGITLEVNLPPSKVIAMTTQRPLDPLGQHIGLRLRKIRTRRHMSLSSVGEFIEVSAQQIARYESGQHRISAVSLYRLARAMDIPLSWFFSK